MGKLTLSENPPKLRKRRHRHVRRPSLECQATRICLLSTRLAPNIERFRSDGPGDLLKDFQTKPIPNSVANLQASKKNVALSKLDRELLRDCLAKAPEAWENLADRFLGLVIHIISHTALARNVSLSQDLRDDLVADVFVSWLDKDFAILRRFRGQSSLAHYLAVVSRRVVLRRISQLRLSQNNQSIEGLNLDPAERETNSYTRDEIEQLESSIERLSKNEAQAVRMFHLEGKSYSEIGSHIGMPENSVGPFLSRAREKIRRLV